MWPQNRFITESVLPSVTYYLFQTAVSAPLEPKACLAHCIHLCVDVLVI